MLSKLCCLHLSTAGIVIGVLGIFDSIAFFILYAYALANVDLVAPVIERSIKEHVTPTALVLTLKLNLAGFGLNFITSIFLIIGILKKRPGLLIPWLVVSGFSVILNIFYCLVFWLNIIVNGERKLPALLTTVPYLSLYLYIYYGIYSLYGQLRSGDAYPCTPGRTRNAACTEVHSV